jgi:steroid delta-isomerase-like uncharacterized protein
MSTKRNKELVSQGIKDWNELGGDSAKMRNWYEKYNAPSATYHRLSRDMNLEQSIQYMNDYSGFPDLKFSIDDMVAEGNKVALRYTMQFTHDKTLRGIPATGKLIVVKGVQIFSIAAGKIVESWDFPDSLGAMTQLGAILSAAPKK